MKERYIRQVRRALRLPRGRREEVVRDLTEIFSSALEHGETEQAVIARLGTPREFAANAEAQLGAGGAPLRGWGGILSCGLPLAGAAAAFCAYAAARAAQSPAGAIGYADAMTGIRLEAACGADILAIILTAGTAAAVIAVVQIARTVRRNRRAR